jgi:hypothetical protein
MISSSKICNNFSFWPLALLCIVDEAREKAYKAGETLSRGEIIHRGEGFEQTRFVIQGQAPGLHSKAYTPPPPSGSGATRAALWRPAPLATQAWGEPS